MTVPFVGGSYPLKRKKADAQQTVNMIVCNVESGSGKARQFLKSNPGLTRFSKTAFALTKEQSADLLAEGDTQTYTVVLTNQGPLVADATITDTLPAGFTFVSCSIAYGGGAAGPASATALELAAGVALTAWPVGGTATLTITGSFADAGTYINTARVLVGDARASAFVTAVVVPPPPGGYTSSTHGTSLSPTEPSGGLAGDALFLFIAHRNIGADPVFTSGVWGTQVANTNDSSSTIALTMYTRTATGTSADGLMDFTVAGGVTSALWFVVRFHYPSDAHFPSGMSSGDYGFASNLNNPPVIKPAGNQAVMAVGLTIAGALPTDDASISSAPSGYTTLGTEANTFTSGGSDYLINLSVAYKQLSGTTEDPSPWGSGSGNFGGGGACSGTIALTYTP